MKGQVEVQESYDLVICESYDLVICEQQHRQYLALIYLQEFFFCFPVMITDWVSTEIKIMVKMLSDHFMWFNIMDEHVLSLFIQRNFR